MRVQPVLLCLVLVSVSFAFKDNRQKRGVEKSEKIRAHEFLDQESAKLVHGKFVPRICGLIRFRGCATLRSAALKVTVPLIIIDFTPAMTAAVMATKTSHKLKK